MLDCEGPRTRRSKRRPWGEPLRQKRRERTLGGVRRGAAAAARLPDGSRFSAEAAVSMRPLRWNRFWQARSFFPAPNQGRLVGRGILSLVGGSSTSGRCGLLFGICDQWAVPHWRGDFPRCRRLFSSPRMWPARIRVLPASRRCTVIRREHWMRISWSASLSTRLRSRRVQAAHTWSVIEGSCFTAHLYGRLCRFLGPPRLFPRCVC